ncbi:MAG: hypothetical protein ACTSX6_04570 [Candidatus Heimdallarchaeaceae archaeon]
MPKNNYWQDYFNNVHPTYMEEWYDKLEDVTIPSKFFQIFDDEREAIINLLDGNADSKALDKIEKKLVWAFKEIKGEKFFVRLGSRSPKDNPIEIKNPRDVFTAFGDSARILEDLTLASMVDYTPYVFVRKWVNMPQDKEFRCFVKNGELKGISQYYYRTKYYYLDKLEQRKLIEFQARKLLTKIKEKFNLKDFIFDICYKPDDDLPLLIEINPFSSWTDPCLFDWALDKFEEFKFKWLEDISKPHKPEVDSSPPLEVKTGRRNGLPPTLKSVGIPPKIL